MILKVGSWKTVQEPAQLPGSRLTGFPQLPGFENRNRPIPIPELEFELKVISIPKISKGIEFDGSIPMARIGEEKAAGNGWDRTSQGFQFYFFKRANFGLKIATFGATLMQIWASKSPLFRQI